jgi:hypothetical protein
VHRFSSGVTIGVHPRGDRSTVVEHEKPSPELHGIADTSRIGTINFGASLEDATWDLALRVPPQASWARRTAELAAAPWAAGPLPAAER